MLSDTLRYFAFGRYWIRFMFNMSMRYHAHCTNLAETFMISQVWLEENDLWLESSLLVTIDILLNYPSWRNNNVWKSFFSLQMFLFQVSLIQTVYSNILLIFFNHSVGSRKSILFFWMKFNVLLGGVEKLKISTRNHNQPISSSKKLWRKLDFDHKRLA